MKQTANTQIGCLDSGRIQIIQPIALESVSEFSIRRHGSIGSARRRSQESYPISETMNSERFAAQWSMPVLMYHRIADPEHGVEPTLTVSVEDFHEQLNWITHHGYASITASHLSEVLDGHAAMPPQPVLLTFDDGYRDLCDFAFPALAESGLSATVFVVTGELGGFSTWDKAFGWNPLPLMSAEQIRQWAVRGIDFGAHSRTHRDLTRIPPEELVSELQGSAMDLSQILGKKVSSFAYPHGRQNAAVRSLAERYFPLAFSCEEGLNTMSIDRMRIRRSMVRPRDSLHAFSHRVSKGVSPFYDLRNWRARARLRSRFRDILSWLRFA